MGWRYPSRGRGLLGHSDADVLAHAVTDALLGAAGLEDIGHYFPDTDERYKDADSIELLREARDYSWRVLGGVERGRGRHLRASKDKGPQGAMRRNLAEALGVELTRVGVRGTTPSVWAFPDGARG